MAVRVFIHAHRGAKPEDTTHFSGISCSAYGEHRTQARPGISAAPAPRIRSACMAAMAACLLTSSVVARADAVPTFSPDTRHVVSYYYSPQSVFRIRTQPHMTTDLRLAPGEVLEALILGNTAQWITAMEPGNVFMKPTAANLKTSGTLVTNLRTYQLYITSSKDGNWYQQVTWHSGPMVAIQNPGLNPSAPAPSPVSTTAGAPKPAARQEATPDSGQTDAMKNISHLHFNYAEHGHAEFRPTEVFDNGTFTWIKIPAQGNAPMPVIFVREHGQYGIANYVVKGHYLIVQQLFKKAELRIGNRVVVIQKD